MGGNYGGSTEGSREGGGNGGGGVSGIGGSGVGGSTEGSREGGGGNTTSASTTSAATPGGNQPSGGVSGIASSGSFNGPGVSSLNAPATATSAQAYSNYNTPSANPPGGIASLGNQTQNTAFGGFQGPGVGSLNAPVNNTLGPRAASPQYANAPTAGLGTYVSPPKQFTDRVPTTYNDIGVAGVPGGIDQRFQYNQPTGSGIPADSGPFAGGYGNFDPATQSYAVDRGLIGSQNFAENYTPQQSTVSTVGANSPFADQSVQAYNPVQSFQNYVVPAAQALAGTPAGMNFTPNYPGQIAAQTGLQNQAIAAPPSIPTVQSTPIVGVSGLANPTQVTSGSYIGPGTDARWASLEGYGQLYNPSTPAVNPTTNTVAGPGNMRVTGGKGTVAFDSLGAAPPGYGNAQGIAGAAPGAVTPYGPMVDQYSYMPPEQVAAGTENIYGVSRPTPYAATTALSQQVLANRAPQQAVVADNTPTYDTSNDLPTLPDPAAPTDQYVPPIVPGQEDYRPGTNPVDWAGRGDNQYVYNQPTTPPPAPPAEKEDNSDNDGLGWMKYYPNQYASQSQTVALPELTYVRDPVSTGVGSLLPNIRVTPYRTI
jgi:hypothetical protein